MSTRQIVVDEALSWVGTPYHHHARVKGQGVDCAMLLAEVFERCGLVARVEAGDYPTDWHLHMTQELFLEWIERCGGQLVPEPQPGDIALFRFGRTFSHGAVVVDEQGMVVHAYLHRGAICTRLTEAPLADRQVRFFSLFKG